MLGIPHIRTHLTLPQSTKANAQTTYFLRWLTLLGMPQELMSLSSSKAFF